MDIERIKNVFFVITVMHFREIIGNKSGEKDGP